MRPVLLAPGVCALLLLHAGLAAAQQSSTSSFVSQTKIALQNQSAQGDTYSYTFSLTFPTQTTGTLVVTIKTNQRYAPTAQDRKSGAKVYGLSFNSSSQGNQSTYNLKFFVPYSSLPADLAKQLQARARPAAFSRGKAHLVAATYAKEGQQSQPGPQQYQEEGQDGGESGGFWEEAGETIVETGAGKVEQAAENPSGSGQESGGGAGQGAAGEGSGSGGGEGGPGSPLVTLLSNLYGVNQALTMSDKDAALLEQMLAYIDCGKNPTVFLPMASPENAQLVSQAESIFSSAVSTVEWQFVNSGLATGLGLISGEEAPIVLGKAAGSLGSGLAGKQLDQLLQQDLQEIEQMFTLCKGTWYGTYSVTTTILNPTAPAFIYDSGVYHLTTQLGKTLKGTMTGGGRFTQGGVMPGEGTFSYTGTMYGERDPGIPQFGQSAGASSNSNAELSTGTVTPPMFTVHWFPPAGAKQLFDMQTTSTMPTPTFGSLVVQFQDGVDSSGQAPPPGSQFYNSPISPQLSYTFTVHKLK
jgi:hypothetical protein